MFWSDEPNYQLNVKEMIVSFLMAKLCTVKWMSINLTVRIDTGKEMAKRTHLSWLLENNVCPIHDLISHGIFEQKCEVNMAFWNPSTDERIVGVIKKSSSLVRKHYNECFSYLSVYTTRLIRKRNYRLIQVFGSMDSISVFMSQSVWLFSLKDYLLKPNWGTFQWNWASVKTLLIATVSVIGELTLITTMHNI